MLWGLFGNRTPAPPSAVDRLCELLTKHAAEWEELQFNKDSEWRGIKHPMSGVAVCWRWTPRPWGEWGHEVNISPCGDAPFKLSHEDSDQIMDAVKACAVARVANPPGLKVAEEVQC